MSYKSINPVNGELFAEHPYFSQSRISEAISKAETTFHNHWKNRPVAERIKAVAEAGRLMRLRVEEYAQIITEEMGKPHAQAEAEIEKCAWLCDFYANRGEEFLSPETRDVGDDTCYIRYDPLGAIFGVMPWNFPFWQAMRYAVPALVAGNVVMLKPASNVPGSGLALEKLFHETTHLDGAFQCLLIDTNDTETVISADIVRGVTLTGSEKAGSAVAALAGKHLKKSVLELGGSDPFIVLEDADLDLAADTFIQSRMNNNGQTCIAAKRCFVHQKAFDSFLEKVTRKASAMRVGDPNDPDTDISCLSRPDIADELQSQVDASIEMGARVVLEGGRVDATNVFRPVILTDIKPGMPVYEEEVFGPVAVVIPFTSDEEAVAKANRSNYGLGCSIFSRNIPRAERIAAQIESGSLHINKLVSSDPRVPFGGLKHSGYGRELGKEGIREWVNLKSVTISADAS